MATDGPACPGDGDWDVAVLGGGPAGSAAALSVRRNSGLRVCLVEPGPHRSSVVGESIPPDARLDLERLGAWDAFAGDAHEPCLGSCSAWGSDTLGYNDFLLNPYGPGWHLDRPRFNRTLLDLATASGAVPIDGTFVGRPTVTDGRFVLDVLDGRSGAVSSLTARFVVDATGRRAAFARAVGAARVVLDRLTVVCGFFDGVAATSPSRLTMLEAEADGWWYAAALPGGRLTAAFATDADTVRRAGLAHPRAWLARCLRTRHVAPRLAGHRFAPEALTVRTAGSEILRPAAGRNWFAVGDAAATYDPLSSQGIQKALHDGSRAASAVLAAAGGAIGVEDGYAADTERAFREYEENRGYFYGLETRWPDSPFWRRRVEAPGRAAVPVP